MLQLLYYPLYVFYAAVFLFLIFRAGFFDITGIKKTHLAFFFLLKVIAGIAITLVYTCYYTDPGKADIYRYFNDSKIISGLLFSHPLDWLKVITGPGTYDISTFGHLQNTLYFSHPGQDVITNNTFLIRIISLLNYFSFYNIYIDTLLLNCLTFVALVCLFKALFPFFITFPQILYWPLFLLPSFVFWSSGLLKEGLLIIGISVYVFSNLNINGLFKGLGWSLFGILIVGLTKIYVAGVMVFCGALLLNKNRKLNSGAALALKLSLYLVFIILAWQYAGDHLCSTIIHKRNEFIQLAVAEHSGSILDTATVGANCRNIGGLIPSAFVNSVVRPFLWDKGPLFQLFFAFENSAFILLQVLLLVFFFKWPKGEKLWLSLFCILFAMLNYVGIGLTVPVLGAIVHYRIIAMPFLLLSVLLMIDQDRVKTDVTRLFSYLNIKI